MKTTSIAIAGLGTVGSGVVEILNQHGEALARRVGSRLLIKHALVRDAQKPRDVHLPPDALTEDMSKLADPEISVIIEVIGGTTRAAEIVRAALSAGKSVVTANKALIAEQGPELFQMAAASGASLAFDAAVAGGIPIVTNVVQCLAANQIESICGILNGTCNFMLSQMEEEQRSYESALQQAQRLGYAEADPSMDVDGTDTAQKLAILAQLGMQARVEWRSIPRMGIERIDAADIAVAGKMGYRIRLIGCAERQSSGKVSLHVAPTWLPIGSAMASVDGPDNAILIRGDSVGNMVYRGTGAGRLPTASAVVADLLDTVSGRAQLTFDGLQNVEMNDTMSDPGDAAARYYLRLPGVSELPSSGEIASALVRHGIAIANSVESESHSGNASYTALVTQTAKATAINAALSDLEALPSVTGRVTWARVEDA